MIKERVYYTVACDNCGDELKAEATSRIVSRDLAIANKWKVAINGEGMEMHLCPRCKEAKKTWYYGG